MLAMENQKKRMKEAVAKKENLITVIKVTQARAKITQMGTLLYVDEMHPPVYQSCLVAIIIFLGISVLVIIQCVVAII